MNKKYLMFIALIFSTLSIIFIAVWGTLPENTNLNRVESITFSDFDEKNVDGDKFKDVYGVVAEHNSIYMIDFEYAPLDAYTKISASTTTPNITLQVDITNKKILVYFSISTIGQTVTIRVIDEATQVSDELTLWFKTPGQIIVPDID